METILEGFRGVAAASVCDAVDAVIGRPTFMSPDIRAVSPGKLVGPAATVLEGVGTEARPPLHALQAIDTSERGSVIVIGMEDPEAGRRVAVWGGLMTTGAMVRGLPGRCSTPVCGTWRRPGRPGSRLRPLGGSGHHHRALRHPGPGYTVELRRRAGAARRHRGRRCGRSGGGPLGSCRGGARQSQGAGRR